MNEITREILGNVGLPKWMMIGVDLFIVVLLIVVFTTLIRKRWKLYHVGKDKIIDDLKSVRLKRVLQFIFLQQKMVKSRKSWGWIHIALYSGMVVLFIGTVIVFLQEYVFQPIMNWYFFQGNFYIVFSFLLDLFGLFAVVSVLLFAWRRMIQKNKSLDLKPAYSQTLILLFLVLLTGFLVEAARIAQSFPDFEKWSFVGWTLAHLFPAGLIWHRVLWWVHLFFAVTLMLSIIPSTLKHILTSSLNTWFARVDLDGKGTLIPISQEEFETAETFGVSQLQELNWQQILSADACTACGRCTDVCPAQASGKILDPKKIMQDIFTTWEANGPQLLMAANEDGNGVPLSGDVITHDEIWACTNCRACVEVCPVSVEHVDIIDDMRRNLVMVEGKMPEELEGTLRNMETQGNPWGLGGHKREEWCADLDVPIMRDVKNAEVLFYVGCAGAFNQRNQEVSKAMVKIMKAAGVDFAILGEEEKCCGDHARRAGNEYLYQMMVTENMETLNKYGVKKIVTTCPHGYHNLKNEYGQFGAEWEVFHHTEFINALIRDGKLKLNGNADKGTVVFHDSCFMARYNGVVDEPRHILKSAGFKTGEMERHGEDSFCCGAGGARMWMEEEKDQRVNIIRVNEALNTPGDSVCVSCPYCMTMFEDGMKEFDNAKPVKDLAEVVAEQI